MKHAVFSWAWEAFGEKVKNKNKFDKAAASAIKSIAADFLKVIITNIFLENDNLTEVQARRCSKLKVYLGAA